ncbi:MAG: amino acid decarboxylase [Chloroflexi bacterium]|nr:amino acid decarboxylase [Chloroflexota bacterium]
MTLFDDSQITLHDESLDPATTEAWESLKTLGHQMVDDMFDTLRTVRERPVWRPLPDDAKARMAVPVPHDPQDPAAVYADFVNDVLPYPMGNIHPRFWGWVIGTGTPLGALGDFLAAVMNPNTGGGEHIANYVELQAINWLKEAVGYPAEASGVMVSGASASNLLALTVARNQMAGWDVRKLGVKPEGAPRLMFYASSEVHSCVPRAVEVLGLGRESLRIIPVNDAFEIDIAALERAIAEDRAAGHRPVCVVGAAGTVNTGAFDDLNTLADLCARENLWFHVDGAFGALAALSPELRPLTRGMERADSLTFDLHKWMYINYEAAVVLVRSQEKHYKTFTTTPEYLVHGKRGASAGEVWFSDLGIQLSRGFKALKVWMSIKEHGIDKYGRLIAQNVAHTRKLAARVDAEPELERLAPSPLNIVCFRYVVPGLDDDALNALNEELLLRQQEGGGSLVSSTRLHGKYCLRACISNHRTTAEDVDVFVADVLALGRQLAKEIPAAG